MRYKRNVINQPRPGAVVILEILHVPGCPGADLLAARLDTLLAGAQPGSAADPGVRAQ